MMRGKIIYTLGHSNRSIEEFLGIITKYGIRVVFDVRRFPSSRKFPHFNRENLEHTLRRRGVEYYWMENLGGYRGYVKGANKYKCFRAQGYRNYVAWMETNTWRIDFQRLVKVASKAISAVMCSERIPWRCHRKLIADALLVEGFKVIHIIDADRIVEHKLTKCARIVNGKLTYI